MRSTRFVSLLIALGLMAPLAVIGGTNASGDERSQWVQGKGRVEWKKLRDVGTPMRWYRGEKRGYMHESTVEFIKAKN